MSSHRSPLFILLCSSILFAALFAVEARGAPYTVSGQVTALNDAGTPQENVILTLNPGGKSVTTDYAGNYTIADVPNGTYTITPALTGAEFVPASFPGLVVNGADSTHINFKRVPKDQVPISNEDAVLFGRRYGGWSDLRHSVPAQVYRGNREIIIAYHHDPNHCRTAGGLPVNHSHFTVDYDQGGDVPTKEQGKAFWDWVYQGWRPGTVTSAVFDNNWPTVKRNCHAYAYDGYKNGAVAQFWVHLQGMSYLNELNVICRSGNDCSKFDALNGDRCTSFHHNHSWILTTTGNPGPATVITWKMGTSGIYVCTLPQEDATNCGPLVRDGDDDDDNKLWTSVGSYSIYRK